MMKKAAAATKNKLENNNKKQEQPSSPARRTSPRGKRVKEEDLVHKKAAPSPTKKPPPKEEADKNNNKPADDGDAKPAAVDTKNAAVDTKNTNKKRSLNATLPTTKDDDTATTTAKDKDAPKKSKVVATAAAPATTVHPPPPALNSLYHNFPSSSAFTNLTPIVQASLLPKPPRVVHDFDVFFPKLVLFQKAHGHCRVPISYPDPNLNSFVKGLRRKYQKIQEWECATKQRLDDHNSKFSLSKTQIDQLNAIGFDWTARRGRPKKEGGSSATKTKATKKESTAKAAGSKPKKK